MIYVQVSQNYIVERLKAHLNSSTFTHFQNVSSKWVMALLLQKKLKNHVTTPEKSLSLVVGLVSASSCMQF